MPDSSPEHGLGAMVELTVHVSQESPVPCPQAGQGSSERVPVSFPNAEISPDL